VNHYSHGTGLVAELLDHDVPVVGNDSSRRALCRDVFHHRVRRGGIASILLAQLFLVGRGRQLASKRADPVAQHQ
jgi:hypothetical protein